MQAQAEHHEQARTFQRLTGEMRGELAGATPPGINPKGLAVVALKKKNFGAVQTMIQQGEIKPEDLPDLKRRAKQSSAGGHPAFAQPTSDLAPASVAPAGLPRYYRPITDIWKDKGTAV